MFNLKTGDKYYTIDIPDREVQLIKHIDPEKKITPEIFKTKLQKSFYNVNLHKQDILIVVSDKTRKCQYDLYLPVLVNFLNENKTKRIRFIIAYGSHTKQEKAESLLTYGEIFEKYDFIHPLCDEPYAYLFTGKTQRNTPVRVRNEIYEANLLITFGAVSHHYFAGYGGGRKLIFPGLAEKNAIYHNHSLFLDKENKCLHSACKPGNLAGNPVAEDLKEINNLLPSRIDIMGILNTKGEVCDLEIGNSYYDFEKICTEYDRYYMSEQEELFDLVIASCGGYPKDINFIQSHKAVHNAASFVRDGGKLIIYTECRDGIGSNTFLPYFEIGYTEAFKNLSKKYEGNGGTALAMMQKTKRIKIFLVTNLKEDLCEQIGTSKITHSEIHKIIKENHGIIAIIENAGMIVKK